MHKNKNIFWVCRGFLALEVWVDIVNCTVITRGRYRCRCVLSSFLSSICHPVSPSVPLFAPNDIREVSLHIKRELVRVESNWRVLLKKLQQLQRLRSEDNPHRLMITHTIDSYRIPSQNENIGQGQKALHATHPLMLMMICVKYGKNYSRIVDFCSRWKPIN